MSQTYLVTGASGHLGRRVLELLADQAPGALVATTRTPEAVADFASHGVEIRAADFDDAASLATAFAGVDRLLLISTDSADGTGRRIRQHRQAVAAAKEAGVQHIVYTSVARATDSPLIIAADHVATEVALAESGLGYTVLRNNFYSEGLIPVLKSALASGRLLSAAAGGRINYLPREDCALAAVAALRADFHDQRVLEINGATPIGAMDAVRLAGEIAGRPVAYVELSAEDLVTELLNSGTPRPAAEFVAGLDVGIAQGALDIKTDDFAELTGRDPEPVEAFLERNRQAFLA